MGSRAISDGEALALRVATPPSLSKPQPSPAAPRGQDVFISGPRPVTSTPSSSSTAAPTVAPSPPVNVPPAGLQTHPLLLALSLLLIACNLRPVFGSLSVVLPDIMRDTGLGATGASLLTTLPIICLGIFSAPAPALARRFGVERTLLGAMVLICVGTVLRAWVSLPLLFASSVLAGAGIALGNVLLLGLIKRDFPRRAAMMTGLYTLAICAGASVATAFTVPLEQHLFNGAWAPALASWALPAFVVTLLWAPIALSTTHRAVTLRTAHSASAASAKAPSSGHPSVKDVGESLARNRLAWQVTVFMGTQSAMAYIVMGWLAPILRERGLTSEAAGYVVATAILTQLATSLVTPSIAARCKDQRALASGLAVLVSVSLLALIFAPLSGRWFWAVALGCGLGSAFSLALSLIVMRSPNVHVTAQLSAMAQGWGYALAAFGPLLVGLMRGWTGSFASAATLIAVLAVAMAWSGWGAGRNLLVQPGEA